MTRTDEILREFISLLKQQEDAVSLENLSNHLFNVGIRTNGNEKYSDRVLRRILEGDEIGKLLLGENNRRRYQRYIGRTGGNKGQGDKGEKG